jgi:prophage regulatory protein
MRQQMTIEHAQTTRFLRLPEVKRLIGLSRSQIYKMQGEGSFPSSIGLSKRAVAWSELAVRDWMSSKRNPKRKAAWTP